MKLSTRSRYGLRALLEVAAAGSGPVILRSVCEKQDLSPKYLERIFSDLRKAGILKSVRGAGGGFLLSREPAAITALEVVEALEKGFGTAECVSEPAGCGRSPDCQARKAWVAVFSAMRGALGSMTLADLMCGNGEGGDKPASDFSGGRSAHKAGRMTK